jgi:hypothetical protein
MSATPIYDAAAWAAGFAPMDDWNVRVDVAPQPNYCIELDDDASHAMEQRHLEGAIHALSDDEWDDLPAMGA